MELVGIHFMRGSNNCAYSGFAAVHTNDLKQLRCDLGNFGHNGYSYYCYIDPSTGYDVYTTLYVHHNHHKSVADLMDRHTNDPSTRRYDLVLLWDCYDTCFFSIDLSSPGNDIEITGWLRADVQIAWFWRWFIAATRYFFGSCLCKNWCKVHKQNTNISIAPGLRSSVDLVLANILQIYDIGARTWTWYCYIGYTTLGNTSGTASLDIHRGDIIVLGCILHYYYYGAVDIRCMDKTQEAIPFLSLEIWCDIDLGLRNDMSQQWCFHDAEDYKLHIKTGYTLRMFAELQLQSWAHKRYRSMQAPRTTTMNSDLQHTQFA
ncbi:hypothetical protein K7X08_035713 [Anisodus acutangulus]|uniref:Uncharacterized protein n=1 Tax=Anisodus acutangulus TaxID=402998 RepID=A0A9Q1M431_9SOLA|nr:hypothetical protein K7X08_035713 [Anisodus acutangulus]